MSYEKVRTIKIKDNKVFIKCASNNCRPLTYDENEYPYFTKILLEKGKDAVEIALLKSYEEGNLQEGINKYSRALKVLRHFEEYKQYDWRLDNTEEKRKSEEFNKLLLRALKTKLPKDKFILSKPYYNNGSEKAYLRKITKLHAFWIGEKERAKTFCFKDDCERAKRYISNSENWIVEKLN